MLIGYNTEGVVSRRGFVLGYIELEIILFIEFATITYNNIIIAIT
jgi:hypothetical protein